MKKATTTIMFLLMVVICGCGDSSKQAPQKKMTPKDVWEKMKGAILNKDVDLTYSLYSTPMKTKTGKSKEWIKACFDLMKDEHIQALKTDVFIKTCQKTHKLCLWDEWHPCRSGGF